jgi:hypothetical protein
MLKSGTAQPALPGYIPPLGMCKLFSFFELFWHEDRIGDLGPGGSHFHFKELEKQNPVIDGTQSERPLSHPRVKHDMVKRIVQFKWRPIVETT